MKSCPECGQQNLADDLEKCPECHWLFTGPVTDYAALPPGAILKNGEYEILDMLGRGGFAFTYRARQRNLGREVAIKELFSNNSQLCQRVPGTFRIATQSPREMELLCQDFRKEAEQLCRLEHPGIVRVFNHFADNDTEYMVMELILGKSLERWRMEEGSRLKPNQAREKIQPLFEAVAWLHEQGMVHRDINPRNIMIRDDDTLMLIDFGLARSAGSVAASRSIMAATDGYSPPEQYYQENPRGTAIDIYSLGAVLYFLVRGEPPPQAMQRKENHARLRWPRGISKRLRSEIEHALVLEADERPATVEAWLGGLQEKKASKQSKKTGKGATSAKNDPREGSSHARMAGGMEFYPEPPKVQAGNSPNHPGKKVTPWQRVVKFMLVKSSDEENVRMIFWTLLLMGMAGVLGYYYRLHWG